MCPDGEASAPHDAMFYALHFLGVKDIISVERVCKSFRNAVRSDPLLWRNIIIDWPLNERITDDVLVKLTSRAQGTLRTLGLVHCVRITDSGLQGVFDSNPRITKLSVPGCLKISVECILLNIKTLKSAGNPGIKQLRIAGLSGITDKQFEELTFLLGADNHIQLRAPKPRFFKGGLLYGSCDDDCPFDIEACPRCQRFTVFLFLFGEIIQMQCLSYFYVANVISSHFILLRIAAMHIFKCLISVTKFPLQDLLYSCISHETFWVQFLALINYMNREGSNNFVNLSNIRKDGLAS